MTAVERELAREELPAEALRLRYGAEAPRQAAGGAAIELLLSHRSVRAYRDAPLPEGALEAMVAAAQSASTSSNLQAWSVVAVEEPARRARLSKLAGDQRQIEECPVLLVWLADLSRLARVAEDRGLPHGALDYAEMFLLAAIDAALAAQNAAVAAEALGLGVVYIGGIRNEPRSVADELGLPPRVFPVFGMCVGWPDPERPATVKPRLPQAAVLHRERYDASGEAEAVASYAAVMAEFYREQGMRVDGDWRDHSARRVAGPHTLSGRDTIFEAIVDLGFEMR